MSANRLPSITFRRARVPGIAAFFRFRENVTQSLLFRERGTTLGAYAVIGLVQPGIAIRWIIWYDLGFGTRRRETESKRLHHENGSLAAAAGTPNARVFDFSQRRGKPGVLNELITHCTGDIVVFSDANTMLAADAVVHL